MNSSAQFHTKTPTASRAMTLDRGHTKHIVAAMMMAIMAMAMMAMPLVTMTKTMMTTIRMSTRTMMMTIDDH